MEQTELDKKLTGALRAVRFEGWEQGKKQKDAPYDYTLHDETFPIEQFKAIKQLIQQEREAVVNDFGRFLVKNKDWTRNGGTKSTSRLTYEFRKSLSSQKDNG